MRNQVVTRTYYVEQLGFSVVGEYGDYLLLARDGIELHFFLFKDLDPKDNHGQAYIRTDAIEELYHSLQRNGVRIHPNAPLQAKAWGQREFAVLDPDNNLLTFGQAA